MSISTVGSIYTFTTPTATATNWSSGHTVDVGTTYLLLGLATSTSGTAVSNMTWQGSAMTLLQTNQQSTNMKTQLWGLANPTAGTGSLGMTWNIGSRGGWGAVNLAGIKLSAITSASTSSTNAASSNASSAYSGTVGNWAFSIIGTTTGDATTITAGSSQTELSNFVGASGGANAVRIGFSVQPGASNVTSSWVLSTNRAWSMTVLEFAQDVQGGVAGTSTSLRNAMYRRRRRS